MAQTGFFHHIASGLLFLAFVMILVTCISAPVIHQLGLLKVENSQDHAGPTTIYFGTLGYCTKTPTTTSCTRHGIGYSPLAYLASFDKTAYPAAAVTAASGLTRTMVFHPIACAILVCAFLLGFGADTCGSLLAAAAALLAFLVAGLALACDVVGLGQVRAQVNADGSGSVASFGAALWTCAGAAALALLGTVLMFLSCCSARFHRPRPVPADAPAPVAQQGGYPNY